MMQFRVPRRNPTANARRSAAAWPPEKMARLRRLAGEGMCAADIAAVLGASKSAIIGKAHRLGVKLRHMPGGRKKGAKIKADNESCGGVDPAQQCAGEPGGWRRDGGEQPCNGVDSSGPLKHLEAGRDRDTKPGRTTKLRREPKAGPAGASQADERFLPGSTAPAAFNPPGTFSGRGCRWPLWPDDARKGHPDFGRYCGAERARGSYCHHHARGAYTLARKTVEAIAGDATEPPPTQET